MPLLWGWKGSSGLPLFAFDALDAGGFDPGARDEEDGRDPAGPLDVEDGFTGRPFGGDITKILDYFCFK